MAVVGFIYHIATCGDWERALRDGTYTTSTIGRTLADEGFIHAADLGQVTGVANRYYKGVPDDLLVLVIDTELVRAEIRYEEVAGAAAPYPHIYGPLNADAVIAACPLLPEPGGDFMFSPGSSP